MPAREAGLFHLFRAAPSRAPQVNLNRLAFEQQFHYGMYYAFVKLKEGLIVKSLGEKLRKQLDAYSKDIASLSKDSSGLRAELTRSACPLLQGHPREMRAARRRHPIAHPYATGHIDCIAAYICHRLRRT